MADKTLEEVKELENAFNSMKEAAKVMKDIRCYNGSGSSLIQNTGR